MKKIFFTLIMMISILSCGREVKNGDYKIVYKDNTIEKGSFSNKLKDGNVEIITDNQKEIFTYSKGILNGQYNKYENNELVESSNYINGLKQGLSWWVEDGYIIKGNLVGDGVKHGHYEIYKDDRKIGSVHYFLNTQRGITTDSYKDKNEFNCSEEVLVVKGKRQGNYSKKYKDIYLEYGQYLDDKKDGRIVRDYNGRIDIETYSQGILQGRFSYDFIDYRGSGVFNNNVVAGKYSEFDSYSNELTNFNFENGNLVSGNKIIHFDNKVKYIATYENFLEKEVNIYTLKDKHIDKKKKENEIKNVFDVDINEIKSFEYNSKGSSNVIEYIKDGKYVK